MAEKIKVILKQGPVLEGPKLIAALKRLIEIGRSEREERANGRETDTQNTASSCDRDQTR